MLWHARVQGREAGTSVALREIKTSDDAAYSASLADLRTRRWLQSRAAGGGKRPDDSMFATVSGAPLLPS